ncbi:MAG: aspartate 1-decarboxylase [Candidatus Krumholzibacteriota bacterium]|nr:aspartate 1-decarboxylase [Candidatus Krumholzibacteriota bacterium]
MLPHLHPSFVRNVVYPLYRGIRGDRVLDRLRELERSQWLPREELDEIRWRKLAALLEKASIHVPYYRDLFRENGIAPGGIQSLGDFARLPFLDREIVRREKRRLVTEDPYRRGYPSSTGGSTGEPMFFWRDRAAGPVRRANTLRGYRWAGVDIGDRHAVLWGRRLDVSSRERFAEGMRNWFNNVLFLSSLDMSPDSMRRYARLLRRFRPHLVVGYPSALALFADFCKRGLLHVPAPRAVVTSGERLYPEQKAAIEDVCRAPVFDRYGIREFSNVAQECEEHKGLHVFSDLFHVEIIHESGRPAQSGEVGEIVVTDLLDYYMPFIRYRTGDLAVPTERSCPCGRGLPLLERIEGRTYDTVVTADGRSIGGFFWSWLSRYVPGIDRFQIDQRDRAGITFRIVPGPGWRDEHKEMLRDRIRKEIGADFRVNFSIVDDIPRTPAGKSKFIVSRIEERLVVKSKIHKAWVTEERPEEIDCLVIDGELMDYGDIAPMEKVLIVDATNGSRIETFAVRGKPGSGVIAAGGAVSRHVRAGDEIGIMAFAWSDGSDHSFSNILVDEKNRFVRHLTEKPGMKL